MKVPDQYREVITDVLKELEKKRAKRPHEIRSVMEAWGLIREEYLELEDSSREDYDEPVDDWLHDVSELIAISSPHTSIFQSRIRAHDRSGRCIHRSFAESSTCGVNPAVVRKPRIASAESISVMAASRGLHESLRC